MKHSLFFFAIISLALIMSCSKKEKFSGVTSTVSFKYNGALWQNAQPFEKKDGSRNIFSDAMGDWFNTMGLSSVNNKNEELLVLILNNGEHAVAGYQTKEASFSLNVNGKHYEGLGNLSIAQLSETAISGNFSAIVKILEGAETIQITEGVFSNLSFSKNYTLK